MSYYFFVGFLGLVAALFTIGVKEEDRRYKIAALVLFALGLAFGLYQLVTGNKL